MFSEDSAGNWHSDALPLQHEITNAQVIFPIVRKDHRPADKF